MATAVGVNWDICLMGQMSQLLACVGASYAPLAEDAEMKTTSATFVGNRVLDDVVRAGTGLLTILLFWMFPVMVAAVFQRRSAWSRAAWLGCWMALLVLFRATGGPVRAIALECAGLIFYGALCAAIFQLARWRASGMLGSFPTAVLAALLFVLLPATAYEGAAQAGFLVAGWNMMFSAYSYCADGPRSGATFKQCMFFLWVDPSMVFTNRASPDTDPRLGRAMARLVVGVFVMFAAILLQLCIARVARRSTMAWSEMLPLCGLLQLYGAHSGLASIQIGLLGAVGYRVPERYNYPFLAKNPMDFWRRWNIYAGSWLRQYVFLPGARRLSRTKLRGHRACVQALATFAAFGTAGLTHDLATYTRRFDFSLHATCWFLVAALVLVLWPLIVDGPRKLLTDWLPQSWSPIVGRGFEHAMVLATIAGMGVWYHS